LDVADLVDLGAFAALVALVAFTALATFTGLVERVFLVVMVFFRLMADAFARFLEWSGFRFLDRHSFKWLGCCGNKSAGSMSGVASMRTLFFHG
jgi:hypothetical protein